MSRACNSQPNSALWSSREMEILAVTLKLLQEQGFERLTVGDVGAAARASKATLYRRWKTKGELVLARCVLDLDPSRRRRLEHCGAIYFSADRLSAIT